MLLTIPDLIDDYNHHMGGVDTADQLRASYNTHLSGVRNWLPLFYWLVDTLKVNSYLLWRMQYPQAKHKDFQLDLSQQLIIEGIEEHKSQLILDRVVPGPAIPVPGLPPPQITPVGAESYRVQNMVHCLSYIHTKKAQVRKCIVCKKFSLFHCINCRNALCSGPGATCIDRYPCTYIVEK